MTNQSKLHFKFINFFPLLSFLKTSNATQKLLKDNKMKIRKHQNVYCYGRFFDGIQFIAIIQLTFHSTLHAKSEVTSKSIFDSNHVLNGVRLIVGEIWEMSTSSNNFISIYWSSEPSINQRLVPPSRSSLSLFFFWVARSLDGLNNGWVIFHGLFAKKERVNNRKPLTDERRFSKWL